MKKLLFMLVIITVLLCQTGVLYAEDSSGEKIPYENFDAIDLNFIIGSSEYKSHGEAKQLDVAPFIEDESTLVPFRAILEELGYTIEWDEETSTIYANNDEIDMQLQIGNNTAIINDEEVKMVISPKIVGGRTVVPLRFISENSGANVQWDGATKGIRITTASQYDTGIILLFDKQSSTKEQNKILIYNGNSQNIKSIPIGKNELVNWYTYKGKALLTIFDKDINSNKISMIKNGELVTMVENFEIKEAFEYNDNLLIHGYDRKAKSSSLYRFDGEEIDIVAEDFYVGSHIIINDKLLINQYDSNRNYMLLVFDKDLEDPWEPTELSNGFIIKNTVRIDNVLYISGAVQDGLSKPFACYDTNDKQNPQFRLLNENIDIDLNNIAVLKGKIYTVLKGVLYEVSADKVEELLFDDLRYKVDKIKVYNNKLYFGFTNIQKREYNEKYDKYEFKTLSKDEKPPYSIAVTEDLKTIDYLLNGVQTIDFKIVNNNLLIHCKRQTGDYSYNEYALYMYSGNSIYDITYTLDVSKIEDIKTIQDNTFMKVIDMDRITNKKRDTLLLFNEGTFSNLVSNVDIKYWESLEESLVFAGYETDIKVNKLYSYDTEFNEVASNLDVKYWLKPSNTLFVNGLNKGNNTYQLFKFSDSRGESIKDNIEVLKIVEANNGYYLICAKDRDKQSATKNKTLLYIYNSANNSIMKVMDNVNVTDMIYLEY